MFIILISVSFKAFALDELKPVAWKKGYIESIDEEKNLLIEEMIFVPEPERSEVNLQAVIFDKKFSRDIVSRYERQFGYTVIQQNIDTPHVNRFSEREYVTGDRVTVEEDGIRKRSFGEFMLRKLSEYHVDKYLKSNEKTRKIYELKKTLSNASVSIKKGYGLKLRYSLSGQLLTARLKNPYNIDARLLIDGSGGETAGETIVVGGAIKKWFVMTNYYNISKNYLTVIKTKNLGTNLGMSLTLGAGFKPNSDDRVLIGFTWKD